MDKMTTDEALNNLKKVCELYQGTWQDHQSLQASLDIIEYALISKAKKEQAPDA